MSRRRTEIRATLRAGRPDWYRITNSNDGTADVYIYDEIGYYGVSASEFAQELDKTNASTINLRINSPGGDVFDGVAIYNALKAHPATVAVTVDGLAASAASYIAMAGDTIAMARGAEMMIHEASGICIGNAVDMRDLAERLDKIGDKIAGFYAERAGGNVTDWRERMMAETWYNGEEAVAAGLADTHGDPVKGEKGGDEKAPENSWDLTIFAHAGRANAPAPIIPSTSGDDVPPVEAQEPNPFASFVSALSKGGHQ